MRRVAYSAIIRQPPDLVFAAAADPNTQLAWDSRGLQSVESLTEGPLARGSRYRGVFKGFGTVEYEFTEYEPSRQFTHLSRILVGEMRHLFKFKSVPEGTQMTQVAEIKPNKLGWVLQPMLARIVYRRFRVIADGLASFTATTSEASP